MKQKQTVFSRLIIAASVVLTAVLFVSNVDAAVKKVIRRIDGAVVNKNEQNLWPIAVMIDNHPAARPQSGLSQASVVYEAVAEGGIPRFMAFFATSTKIPFIGPVRSTRPYFVRFAAEYRAALAHAGGSPDGLILLNSLRMPNVEGVSGKTAKFFFRYGGSGVHNLYTNSTQLAVALKFFKYDKYKPTYRSWLFKTEPKLAGRATGNHGAEIDLGGGASFKIKYQYNRKTNSYLRFTGGRAHIDRLTKKQLAPKNVVIMLVPKEKVLDRKGRLEIKTLGSGKAILMKDGRAMTLKWKKTSPYGRTMFTTLKNKEIEFNRGSVWIEVVPAGHKYKLF